MSHWDLEDNVNRADPPADAHIEDGPDDAMDVSMVSSNILENDNDGQCVNVMANLKNSIANFENFLVTLAEGNQDMDKSYTKFANTLDKLSKYIKTQRWNN